MVRVQQEAIRIPGDTWTGPRTTHLHCAQMGPLPGRGVPGARPKRPALEKKQHQQPSTDRGEEKSLLLAGGEPRRQLAPRTGRWPGGLLPCSAPKAALTHTRCPWSSCSGPSNLRRQGWEEELSGSTPRNVLTWGDQEHRGDEQDSPGGVMGC